jgi:membrane-bound lytic murein transglycosylase D
MKFLMKAFQYILPVLYTSGCATTVTSQRPSLSPSPSKTSSAAVKGDMASGEVDLAVAKPQAKQEALETKLDVIDEDASDTEVVVKNGMVCVPEGSPQASQLSQILEASSIEEDLDHALKDAKASQVPSISLMEKEPAVQAWIQYFSGKDKERFSRFLERGNRYKNIIVKILQEEGVPQEIYYLAMIESGFVTYAKSHASAVGVWQFIKGTGLRYGLRVNYYVDERHDPIRSTRAAARYLASLYRVYQSWELAMAAYNSGEGRVLGAIMRGHTRDFWELAKGGFLPRETSDYVPKFMAAAIIGRDIEKYNFSLNPEPAMNAPVAALVPSGVSLGEIAKTTNTPESVLTTLNPHLRKGITPPTTNEQYYLWVPSGVDSQLAGAMDSLKRSRIKLRRSVQAEDSPSVQQKSEASVPPFHRVKSGENLASISTKYNITVATLRRLNGLRSGRVYVGQKLKLVNKGFDSATHVVKRGDTVEKLASRYGTTPGEIKKLNKVPLNKLRAGQKILVPNAG